MGHEKGDDDPRGIIGLQSALTIGQLNPKSLNLESVRQVLWANHKMLLDCMRKLILSAKEADICCLNSDLAVNTEFLGLVKQKRRSTFNAIYF